MPSDSDRTDLLLSNLETCDCGLKEDGLWICKRCCAQAGNAVHNPGMTVDATRSRLEMSHKWFIAQALH